MTLQPYARRLVLDIVRGDRRVVRDLLDDQIGLATPTDVRPYAVEDFAEDGVEGLYVSNRTSKSSSEAIRGFGSCWKTSHRPHVPSLLQTQSTYFATS